MSDFLTLASRGGLLFDGAMGTLLYDHGVFLNRNFEAVNLGQPELVEQIHGEYLAAGARAITTNTFGANRLRLERHELGAKVRELNVAGVKLARAAAKGRAFICGSVGPTGLTLQQLVGPQGARAEAAFIEQIDVLLETGVDALIFETFYELQEIELAVSLARTRTELPIVALMTFTPEGVTQNGQPPKVVGQRLIDAGADVIGSNCGGGPDLLFRVSTPMVGLGVPVMAQANAGAPEVVDGRMIYVANPEYFGVFARRLFKAGVKVVGGCCGTRPSHIKSMAGAARMMSAAQDPAAKEIKIEGGASPVEPATPVAARSTLGAQLAAGRFVTSVEINPPTGFNLEKKVIAAQALKEAGITTINIADGPRASVRMGNLAMAQAIEAQTGLQPIVHICCRDRSFLGLLSHLLGAHTMGVRNLVVITGDPPKMGAYPNSTGVYDLDSVGLLEVIKGFNAGVDPAGKEMSPTSFVLATGAEPAALDYDRELRRLAMKREAGAEVVMTQPVYDPSKVERFLDDVADMGLPVMLGLCPLASYRNAEFLHNNVPGMQIPDEIRLRMKAADEQGRGQEEGIAIAREALAAVRHRVQGAYIMPPFNRYKVAIKVLDGFLDPPETAECGCC
ncbi:MAG: bifunctional homocysteine S-methyltransferase/methylenetetrahydrofolate reductase [Bradymonadia bacterium]